MKKILMTIGIIFILAIGGFGYLVYKDLKEEEVVKREIIELSNKDLLTDKFDIIIKSKGDYAYVESAIKKFYKELAYNVKKINYYLNDEELINILSINNVKTDGPDFIKSYQLLGAAKTNLTSALQKISQLCSEDYIQNLLNKDKVDEYYVDFYKKLMYTEQDLQEFNKTKQEMEELSNNINLFLDKIKEILDMLKKNQDSWFIEDNKIYFTKTELVDEYNNLYEELQKIANEKLNSSDYFNDDVSNDTADISV